MKSLFPFLIPMLLCLMTGCSSDYWTIQRSESFVNEKNKPKKIICLGPYITHQSKDKNRDLKKLQTLSVKFDKAILRSAKQNNIHLEIKGLDENTDVNYYDKLMYLKHYLVEVNFNDYASVNSTGGGAENQLHKSVYVYPPKISYDFNSYSKQFGTKYFSFLKLVINSESFTFFHVIVDTDLSETVFSERKTINHKFNEALCNQVIYDSFAALSKELKM